MRIYRVANNCQYFIVKAGDRASAARFVGDDISFIAETLIRAWEFDFIADKQGYDESIRVIPLENFPFEQYFA